MAFLTDQFGELGGVICTMLGLTRHSRIRDQLKATVDLYEQVIKHEGLQKSSADLVQVISLQTQRLLDSSTTVGRAWNWPAALLAWTIGGGFATGVWQLSDAWGTWWATLIIIVLGLIGALFGIAGVGVLAQY